MWGEWGQVFNELDEKIKRKTALDVMCCWYTTVSLTVKLKLCIMEYIEGTK